MADYRKFVHDLHERYWELYYEYNFEVEWLAQACRLYLMCPASFIQSLKNPVMFFWRFVLKYNSDFNEMADYCKYINFYEADKEIELIKIVSPLSTTTDSVITSFKALICYTNLDHLFVQYGLLAKESTTSLDRYTTAKYYLHLPNLKAGLYKLLQDGRLTQFCWHLKARGCTDLLCLLRCLFNQKRSEQHHTQRIYLSVISKFVCENQLFDVSLASLVLGLVMLQKRGRLTSLTTLAKHYRSIWMSLYAKCYF